MIQTNRYQTVLVVMLLTIMAVSMSHAQVLWDTVTTTEPWGWKGSTNTNEFVALTVSNHGQFGHNGIGGVNMDFTIEGGDCNQAADVYLYDGSLFLIRDDGGGQFTFNCSLNDENLSSDVAFRPLSGTGWTGGTRSEYDSVYTGVFVNSDSSIALERTYYAPRNHEENPTFVISKTTLWAVDGQPQSGLTIGEVIDWNIPSDSGEVNAAGVSVYQNFVYCQGTDTTEINPDSADCDTSAHRFGAEILLGWYTNSEYQSDPGIHHREFYGAWADSFHGWWNDMLTEENYQVFWDSTAANVGLSSNTMETDQAVFKTWLQDYTLSEDESLTFYTAYVTVGNGQLVDLEMSATDAWYYCCTYLCITDWPPDCIGLRGNVQLEGFCDHWEQNCDISDLTNMIDHLFINYTPLCMIEEADITPLIYGGQPDEAVDISDLTAIIDHLFISFIPMPPC